MVQSHPKIAKVIHNKVGKPVVLWQGDFNQQELIMALRSCVAADSTDHVHCWVCCLQPDIDLSLHEDMQDWCNCIGEKAVFWKVMIFSTCAKVHDHEWGVCPLPSLCPHTTNTSLYEHIRKPTHIKHITHRYKNIDVSLTMQDTSLMIML